MCLASVWLHGGCWSTWDELKVKLQQLCTGTGNENNNNNETCMFCVLVFLLHLFIYYIFWVFFFLHGFVLFHFSIFFYFIYIYVLIYFFLFFSKLWQFPGDVIPFHSLTQCNVSFQYSKYYIQYIWHLFNYV